MLDVSVVLPVYNEEESLTVLWPDLLEVLEFLGLPSK
jgi:glycosyltransferase involved in cell wall biosynthesis